MCHLGCEFGLGSTVIDTIYGPRQYFIFLNLQLNWRRKSVIVGH